MGVHVHVNTSYMLHMITSCYNAWVLHMGDVLIKRVGVCSQCVSNTFSLSLLFHYLKPIKGTLKPLPSISSGLLVPAVPHNSRPR